MFPTEAKTKIIDALKASYDAARGAAENTEHRPSTVVTTWFRSLARAVYAEINDGNTEDGRLQEYRVSIRLWDNAAGEERGELVGETEAETVKGLAGVAALIGETVAAFHGLEADHQALAGARAGDVTPRLATFRTSLSRGGGVAMLRARYLAPDGRPMLAAAHVQRADYAAEEPARKPLRRVKT